MTFINLCFYVICKISVIESGDNCTLAGSCQDPHAECNDSSGTCECIDGFVLSMDGICVECG